MCQLTRILDLLTVYQCRVNFFPSVEKSDMTRRVDDGILFLSCSNETGMVMHRFNSVSSSFQGIRISREAFIVKCPGILKATLVCSRRVSAEGKVPVDTRFEENKNCPHFGKAMLAQKYDISIL